MPKQCCGDCEHFVPGEEYEHHGIGECEAPMPDSVTLPSGYERAVMRADEGRHCPVFKVIENA